MFLRKKHKKDVIFFLKSLIISFQNFLKHFWPKKYQAFNKYAIISAVYNVEKYLDDYFKSIINQRLDFKNNIFIICIDDGSTDNSANIIKKYQRKYPKNIIYLYKDNGGQASARNLGLKYIRENDYKISWVTFTDPDDFLSKDYFYEVDTFLKCNENIALIGTNIIFYREKRKILYKNSHALNFKFKNKKNICVNAKLDKNIQLSVASCFLKLEYLGHIEFDERLTLNFEDAKLINEYLLCNIHLKSAFLKKAKYFYRKRFHRNSTLDKKQENKDFYLMVPKIGYLEILKFAQKQGEIPLFLQNLIVYDLFWQIKELVNFSEKMSFMSNEEIQKYIHLIDEIFCLIDSEVILNFNFKAFLPLHKIGFLNCFKKENVPVSEVFIEELDDKNDEILIKFYTSKSDNQISLLFDGKEARLVCSKIRQYDFLDRVFIYERRIWVKIPKYADQFIFLIDGMEADVLFEEKKIISLNRVYQKINSLKKRRSKNQSLWLFADMTFRADDNAEHLYRYVMQNHSQQKIAFVLKKNSHDWNRLKKEGFNLVDPKSLKFKYLVFRADKLISSHIERYFFEALGENTLKTKDFVFLQHGVTKDDLSTWLNQRKIDLFITATQAEYNSIAGDFNRYKFTAKEVKLTGLARWDNLLKNNQSNTKQILIMPTWRNYIVGSYSRKLMRRKFDAKFYESEYFYRWNSFLQSKRLQQLSQKYHYTLVFNPHPQIRPYLSGFDLPSYIEVPSPETGMQKLFCESSLMVTDYSSVAFEMAVLNKPVIYYQFDKQEFFQKHLQKGYFDYKKDGFGDIALDVNALLLLLQSLLQNIQFDNKIPFRHLQSCKNIFDEFLSV